MSSERPVSFAELWTIISLVVGILSGVGYLVLRDVDHRLEGVTGRLVQLAGLRDDCKAWDSGWADLLRAEHQGMTAALLQQLQSHTEKLSQFKGFMDSEIAMHADCASQRAATTLAIRDLANKLEQHETTIRRLYRDKNGGGMRDNGR